MKAARATPLLLVCLVACLPAFAAGQSAMLSKPPPDSRHIEYTAELQDRMFSGSFRAGSANWQCSKGNCRTNATWPQPAAGTCAILAKQAGRVTRFGNTKRSLDARSLAECNRAAAPAPALATPQVRLTPGAVSQLKPGPAPATVLANRRRFAELGDLRARAEAEARRQRTADDQARRDAASQAWEQRRRTLGYTYRHNPGSDCDDSRRDINPLAGEVCDNRDNNCNGVVDEGQKLAFYLDADGDGHGDPSQPIEACAADQQRAAAEGRWLSLVGNDCDDTDPNRWQGCP